jgi:N-acetyl-anhydromuramyl-L-alanine amidase AmpD
MVGISFSGDTNKRELTQQEVESVVELIAELKAAHPSIVNITTHKEISPGRKNDISDNAMNQIKTALKNGL